MRLQFEWPPSSIAKENKNDRNKGKKVFVSRQSVLQRRTQEEAKEGTGAIVDRRATTCCKSFVGSGVPCPESLLQPGSSCSLVSIRCSANSVTLSNYKTYPHFLYNLCLCTTGIWILGLCLFLNGCGWGLPLLVHCLRQNLLQELHGGAVRHKHVPVPRGHVISVDMMVCTLLYCRWKHEVCLITLLQ